MSLLYFQGLRELFRDEVRAVREALKVFLKSKVLYELYFSRREKHPDVERAQEGSFEELKAQ